MKKCSVCKIEKSFDNFYTDKSSKKDGFHHRCKPCCKENQKKVRNTSRHKEYVKLYREKNKEKIRQQYRNSGLKRNYGITIDEYKILLLKQNNRCAICKQLESTMSRRTNRPFLMSVDHDHKTGRIRGLLCGRCNLALGGFKDDPVLLQEAINYLKITMSG